MYKKVVTSLMSFSTEVVLTIQRASSKASREHYIVTHSSEQGTPHIPFPFVQLLPIQTHKAFSTH